MNTAVLPREGEMVVRKIPFQFPDDLAPVWNTAEHEWSHMVNGASVTMPYLEPFLIATLREALPQIDDPQVVADAKDFIAQEAQHFRTHRRYNELLKTAGYPQLAEVETAMTASYDRIKSKRSLDFKLAYACGFETMTLGVTKWLVGDRVTLFGKSDPRVASFILWHFVEEAEHKRVAFDVYQAASGAYLPRVLGIFTGSLHVFWYSRKACIVMLKADGKWRNLRSRLRLWKRTAQFFKAVVPLSLKSALPGHSPQDEPDPQWTRDWIAGFAQRSDQTAVPLVDTFHPDIPVPFPPNHTAPNTTAPSTTAPNTEAG